MSMVSSVRSSKAFRLAGAQGRALLGRCGYEISRLNTPTDDFMRQLLRQEGIDLVVDVGANTGQYVSHLRRLGYVGRAISFEPSSEAFVQLSRNAAGDPHWALVKLGVGARRTELTLKIAANSVSSSFLSVEDAHVEADRSARQVAEESVEISTLDALLQSDPGQALMLKLDVQGFELEVLEGAADCLGRTKVIQSEISFRSMYREGAVYTDVLDRLGDLGFAPIWFERAFVDPESGEWLQADVVAARR